MYKVYLSASTQHDNVGVGNYGTEADRMRQLAECVNKHIKQGQGDITVFKNSNTATLESSVNESNNLNSNIHIALHSNASGGQGTEVYYWDNDQNSKRLATCLYNNVAPLLKGVDRGIKSDHTLYDNGLYELRETNAVACLIEIMFHDNISDVNDYLSKIDAVGLAIAKAIYNYYNLNYNVVKPFFDATYRVIAGVYHNKDNADKQVALLKSKGFEAFIERK